MRFFSSALFFWTFWVIVNGACTDGTEKRIRKEWRALTTAERREYLQAVVCLQNAPGNYSDIVPGSLDYYEDFVAVHKLQTPYIHFVGHFLPWHRFMMWVYETALQNECGYTGAQPYWDYSIDASRLIEHNMTMDQSEIYLPTDYGFGGNGQYQAVKTPGSYDSDFPPGTGGGCVTTGPFLNYTIHIGWNTTLIRDDRCLQRDFNPVILAEWCTPAREAQIKSATTYLNMSRTLEGGPYTGTGIHGGGHFINSGSDGDAFVSPAEPLFFLHHTNLDRIWWQWQEMNSSRLTEIAGTIAPYTDVFNPNISLIANATGNTTLTFKMNMGRLWDEEVTVGEVMDSRKGLLCYEYE